MAKVIEVSRLSKQYTIYNHARPIADTLVSTLSAKAKHLFGHALKSPKQEFWALRDIDLEIEEGDSFGIIGLNGAGKSTLLKILSRITTPTSGHLSIRGRLANLLEVGSGFHPELSGRENIFLNGAILGLSRREILRKFDEIVAFSEIGHFLDTPIKHYSTGMCMRLGFAVAAYVDPDIMIVDEVLAVGDILFQRKCMGKFNDLSNQGRTIVFVSHDLGSIQNVCNKGIYLEKGKKVVSGTMEECVTAYLHTCQSKQST